ncbi:UDP-glucose 4-epimerase [Cellulophaga geojensis KL-A]|uniref:UDP-glucose 4-epimerase n=1 Tax=Cellulophaga geojensis KL-A TaxID=1328323 RepID=A0ABP3B7K6_9FLAO|nr:UDP-glucose 4-epimerase GalE [Cellulophaga geojensis]EWH13793.1 UDP-glucose 4-epimerase [Cellulophaga geojensis KL-A]
MKEKIIVTGGCGYIGSHTVIELLKSNFEVVILDDLSNSTEKTIDRISQITGKTPTFIHIDLKDELQTNKVFAAHKNAFAVIHFAAHKAVGESVTEPLMYYKNNFYSLINTLHAQTKNNINNFIFSSSATVYGLPKTLPITEKNKTKRPFSPYGNTKKVAEEILEDLTKANVNFNAISLRYFNPIGAHESGLIGELPTGIPNNLMPYVTQTAAGIREKLMVYGNDYPTKDGTPIRDYIHVVDLAIAHVLAVKRLVKNKQEKQFECFNLGTGVGYSVLDIIKTFETVTNSRLNYEFTSRRDGDVPKLYAETKLAAKKLEWTPTRELSEMISSSWKWEQNVRKEQA